MKCPKCGSEGAYIGLNVVECDTSDCEHYKAYSVEEPTGVTLPVGAYNVIGQTAAITGARLTCTSESKRRVPQFTHAKRWNMAAKDGELCSYIGWMGNGVVNVALIDTYGEKKRELWCMVFSRRNFVEKEDAKKYGWEFGQRPGNDAEYATKNSAPSYFYEIWDKAELIPNLPEGGDITGHYEQHKGA